MFHPSLDEKKKLEIARLYNTTNMPMEDIAEKVGVSLRSAYNHRNYGYETDTDPTSSTISETKTEISQSKKGQWECKKCGYITDQKVNSCPGCGWGPFHSFFIKIGSPGHVPYVAPQKEQEITEPEKESCDPTRDYWVCKECDYISNIEFDICPKCGSNQVIFAPDGNEPRDPNEDISEDESEEIESNEEPSEPAGESEEEQEEEEIKFQCGNCNAVFESPVEYCPECGTKLDFEFEYYCTKCSHGFNGEHEKCPNCGDKFD